MGQAPEIDGRLLINDGLDLLPKDLPAFARRVPRSGIRNASEKAGVSTATVSAAGSCWAMAWCRSAAPITGTRPGCP